jgi:sialic acid synthase SpsE
MIELWAEAGPCDNDINKAIEYVHAVSGSGAQALKVQWYRPETLVTVGAERYDSTSGSAKTQRELFANSIYPYQRWKPVIDECRQQGIEFIPSVFDMEAVNVAAELGVKTLKIASGDITYLDLIKAAANKAERIAISTGASTEAEIDAAVEAADSAAVTLMACHLQYPTPLESANVARIYAIGFYWPSCELGFSDHTPGIDTIPLAVAAGTQVIEKHFTLEANQGYDSDFALDPAGLRNAVLETQRTLTLMGDSDLAPTTGEQAGRLGARRSLVLTKSLKAGETPSPPDVAVLRPHRDGSVSPAFLQQILKTPLAADGQAGQPLTGDHYPDLVD